MTKSEIEARLGRVVERKVGGSPFAWFGIDCGSGWFGLLETLAQERDAAVGRGCRVEVLQVKEKFGTLRFYYSGGDATFRKAVDVTEAASATVCEWCGAPGTLRESGWMLTLCDPCDARRKATD